MEDLKSLIQDGIVVDLFKAERAISIIKAIGDRSGKLDSLDRPARTTFSYYQRVCLSEYVMSIARCFDKPSKKNKTRCLGEVIYRLNKNPNSFPDIVETYQVEEHLRTYKFPESLISSLRSKEKDLFARHLGLCFMREYNALIETRQIVKTWRDQILAHNDPNPNAEVIQFHETEKLLDFGWKTVTLIGWAYMSTIFGHGNEYLLRKDAGRYGSEIGSFLDSQFARLTGTGN